MNNNKDEEIDIIEIVKSLWKSRFFIIKVSLIFLFLGVFISLTSPLMYTSSTTFVPQTSQSTGSSGLSGVANLVGINLGGVGSSAEIPPSIYPQIVNSVPYKRELLEINIDFPEKNKTISLKDYLSAESGSIDFLSVLKKYTIMLPFTILDLFRVKKANDKESSFGSEIFISEMEEKLFKTLDGILSISVNTNEGFVSLSSEMGNAYASAVVTKAAEQILQNRVVKYKIKSAKEVLNFNLRQLQLKKIEFDSLQNKLALFKDSNLNIIDSRFQNSLQKLESEFAIVNAVYQELSKQVEQSKLQVSKDTPIFSVIQPASVPNFRSSPKRKQMVLIYTFIGLVIGCLIVLIKKPVLSLIKEVTA
ncbi:MAG: exopolysaccharide biosynthesis protein [Flavobacteriaceae bacterium]|nr:exopolysaccharide biosynthesis protein [Flavobacteriaceae bacterium]|tara:strand:+ start:3474 stop:4559 length:1086 start_codon:yes stop_codon:yes gene_type:complete